MSEERTYQQPQQELDISKADTITCDDCGNASFIPAFFLKRISALLSPTGKEAIVPIQVYSCGNCGVVPQKMLASVQEEVNM